MLAVQNSVCHHDDHADDEGNHQRFRKSIRTELLANRLLTSNHERIEEEQIYNNDNLDRGHEHIEVLSRFLLLDQREQPFEEYVVPKKLCNQAPKGFEPSHA